MYYIPYIYIYTIIHLYIMMGCYWCVHKYTYSKITQHVTYKNHTHVFNSQTIELLWSTF